MEKLEPSDKSSLLLDLVHKITQNSVNTQIFLGRYNKHTVTLVLAWSISYNN